MLYHLLVQDHIIITIHSMNYHHVFVNQLNHEDIFSIHQMTFLNHP